MRVLGAQSIIIFSALPLPLVVVVVGSGGVVASKRPPSRSLPSVSSVNIKTLGALAFSVNANNIPDIWRH